MNSEENRIPFCLLRSLATSLLILGASETSVTASEPSVPIFNDDHWVSMGTLPGANGEILASTFDAEGHLYVAGSFTAIGSVLANRIARWDGTQWHPVGKGMDDTVRVLLVVGESVYAGGDFTKAGDVTVNHIAEWNGQAWVPMLGGFNRPVRALAALDGDVYAGGEFGLAGRNPVSHIAKWNGEYWIPLGDGISPPGQAVVHSIRIVGTDVYVGGEFQQAGEVEASGIAKWNGSTWTGVGEGVTMNSSWSPVIFDMLVKDGGIYVGGQFHNAGEVEASNIAFWDGFEWTALGDGSDGIVLGLAPFQGSVVAIGRFSNISGAPANSIARWDGASWSPLDGGVVDYPNSMSVSEEVLYLMGSHLTEGTAPTTIERWDGHQWANRERAIDDEVRALAMLGDQLLVSARLTTTPREETHEVAMWNGDDWLRLGGMNGKVFSLCVQSSNVFAGGYFSTVDGLEANNVAKWNGVDWQALGTGVNAPVWDMEVSGTNLYIAGETSADGKERTTGVAMWDGANWHPLGEEVQVFGNAIALDGEDVYVAGSFLGAGGATGPGPVGKWDGSSWSWLGEGLNSAVLDLCFANGKLYAAGHFTFSGTVPMRKVAVWDGRNWSAVGEGLPFWEDQSVATAISVLGDRLFLGVDRKGEVDPNCLFMFDQGAWMPMGTGVRLGSRSIVHDLLVANGHLVVAGKFTTAGGKISPSLAMAYLDNIPPLEVFHLQGSARIHFRDLPTGGYRILRSTGLDVWERLAVRYAGESGGIDFIDHNAPAGKCFYRAVPVGP